MKQKIFSISFLLGLVASASLLTGCAEEFDRSYQVEKPAVVTETEQLSQFGVLLSYIDTVNFRLGNTLTAAEFDQAGPAASVTLSNFNEVTIPDLFVHNKLVDAEGNINMLTASSLAKDVSDKGLNLFAPALCPSSNINTSYLSKIIEPEIVEEDEVTGYDIFGFENDAIGATFPLQKATGEDGKGTVVVENDPDGQSGHVIHITKTNQSFPAITLEFPEGRKLGDYSDLTIDFKALNSTALNQKIFFALGGKNAEFKKASEFGCALNAWGRGLITINLAAMSYSDDQNQQTKVTLIMGPKLMNCDYLIDNISLKYKYRPTYEVQKTDQEKFQIISGELNNYITAAMEAAPTIKAWTVADCPVTSASDLIWKQTMGNTYFGYAAQTMRQLRGDAKLFVSEYLMDATVRADFLKVLAEADKLGKVDGIDVLLSVNATSFDAQGYVTMLKDLAATGKLVRLTIQSVAGATDADAGTALAQVVTAYKQQIQGGQQYGITFGAVNESATNAGLWTTGYNRKATYASLVNALQ